MDDCELEYYRNNPVAFIKEIILRRDPADEKIPDWISRNKNFPLKTVVMSTPRYERNLFESIKQKEM